MIDVDCATGNTIRRSEDNDGTNPSISANANQRAYANVLGLVTLSSDGSNGKAHSANHHANTETAGLVKIREIRQQEYEIDESKLKRTGYAMTPCGNEPVRAITDFDLADSQVDGLVRLSKPTQCAVNSGSGKYGNNLHIATNKFDYARTDNPGTVQLSRNPCDKNCYSIAVADNDVRMFKPFMELFQAGSGGQITWADSESDKVTGLQTTKFTYKNTNIHPRSTPAC